MYKIRKLLGIETGVVRLEDGAFIPFAEGNTDYQAYLKWLAEGNQPLPADEGIPPA
jgi:hypothetical protein